MFKKVPLSLAKELRRCHECLKKYILQVGIFNSIPHLPQPTLDVMVEIIRHSSTPVPEIFITRSFPAVVQCVLQTEDYAIMQVCLISIEFSFRFNANLFFSSRDNLSVIILCYN